MAAGTWTFFRTAKEKLGQGKLDFDTRVLRVGLFTSAASASLSAGLSVTTFPSIANEISEANGYSSSGKSISLGDFTLSTNDMTYSGCGVFWSANGGNLGNTAIIKYAVMAASQSSGTLTPLAFVTLSTASFAVGAGSRLTINSGGSTYFKIT